MTGRGRVVFSLTLAAWVLMLLVDANQHLFAGEQKAKRAAAEARSAQSPPAEGVSRHAPEEKLSVTHHTLNANGEAIGYTATAGYLQLKEESGEPRANIFFVAYVRDQQDPLKRPISFVFNGGPGAASVWLHMGAVGPRRAPTKDPDKPEPPPYQSVANTSSWLPFTDLVFIDPVGTGFSRAVDSGKKGNQFYGIKEDIESVGSFIRIYTTKSGRWLSPKFLVGESYGTFRAAGLVQHLFERYGMDFNGLVLISLAMSFQTFSFELGNDLANFCFLPSYTAAAWFHKKLPADLLQLGLEGALREVEDWTVKEYAVALARGDTLTGAERDRVVQALVRYTGLSATYIHNQNLRIDRSDFLHELLREEGRLVGLMDATALGTGGYGEIVNEPGLTVTIGPYMAIVNDYLRNELKFESDLPYVFLSSEAHSQWNWGSAIGGYVDIMGTLKTALSRSEHLQVFVASGYYDLDTPYFGAWYTMSHLGLSPSLQKNVTLRNYESGHQLYTHEPTMRKLASDVASFFSQATSGK